VSFVETRHRGAATGNPCVGNRCNTSSNVKSAWQATRPSRNLAWCSGGDTLPPPIWPQYFLSRSSAAPASPRRSR